MIRIAELKLPLTEVPFETRRAADAPTETDADRAPPPHPEASLRRLAAEALGVEPADIAQLQVFKRSFDARKADLRAVYIVDLTLTDPTREAALLARHADHPHIIPTPDMQWRAPVQAPPGWPAHEEDRPVVIGLGPCGLFAALALAQMGLRPIVLERGRPVRQRTKDTWGLWRKKVLNPQSNVQYGEGGAGLFSDGKLYSQIKDPRFLGRKVMQEFVEAGAPPEILYMAHPHIGTFKLVKVVEAMREKITALGGEIRFEHQVTGARFEPEGEGRQRLVGLQVHHLATGEHREMPVRHAVLALGHSSRDTFAWLWDAGVFMEAKPFSVGFRIEHPQGVIDRARWGRHAGHPLLGAADYKLVHHAANGRAVYSFCMCPGGTVVAATSEPNRVVTNGMSQYSRNERNANAGIVVGISPQDYRQDGRSEGPVSPLDGMAFQRLWESRAYELGEGGYKAPGALVGDFIKRQRSRVLGTVEPSYKPGVTLTDLQPKTGQPVLPPYVLEAIREALPAFERQIKGFSMADAVLTGVETLQLSGDVRLTAAQLAGLGQVEFGGFVGAADAPLVKALQDEFAGAAAGRFGPVTLNGRLARGLGLGVHAVVHSKSSSKLAISTATRAASRLFSTTRATAWASFSTVRMALATTMATP